MLRRMQNQLRNQYKHHLNLVKLISFEYKYDLNACYTVCSVHNNVCFIWFVTMGVIFSVGTTLTVHPSNIVAADQVVTLQCALNSDRNFPAIVIFSISPGSTLCTLELKNGVCKSTGDICLNNYNASCSNETVFSIKVNVPLNWNGISIYCSSLISKSNPVNIIVMGKFNNIFLKQK